ncbi:hypothetical protein HAX54_008207, partial [Datura stramonium]|nr:hypothetical protein [Datura stramonium]
IVDLVDTIPTQQESSKNTTQNSRNSQNYEVIRSSPSLEKTARLDEINSQSNSVVFQKISSIGDDRPSLDLSPHKKLEFSTVPIDGYGQAKISCFSNETGANLSTSRPASDGNHGGAPSGVCIPHQYRHTHKVSAKIDEEIDGSEHLKFHGKTLLVDGEHPADFTVQNQHHQGRYDEMITTIQRAPTYDYHIPMNLSFCEMALMVISDIGGVAMPELEMEIFQRSFVCSQPNNAYFQKALIVTDLIETNLHFRASSPTAGAGAGAPMTGNSKNQSQSVTLPPSNLNDQKAPSNSHSKLSNLKIRVPNQDCLAGKIDSNAGKIQSHSQSHIHDQNTISSQKNPKN